MREAGGETEHQLLSLNSLGANLPTAHSQFPRSEKEPKLEETFRMLWPSLLVGKNSNLEMPTWKSFVKRMGFRQWRAHVVMRLGRIAYYKRQDNSLAGFLDTVSTKNIADPEKDHFQRFISEISLMLLQDRPLSGAGYHFQKFLVLLFLQDKDWNQSESY